MKRRYYFFDVAILALGLLLGTAMSAGCPGDDDDQTSRPPGDDDATGDDDASGDDDTSTGTATPLSSPTPVPTPVPVPDGYPYDRMIYLRGTLNGWTGDPIQLIPYAMLPVAEDRLQVSVTLPFGPLEFKTADDAWSAGTNFGNPPGTDDRISLDVPKTLADNGFNLKLDVEVSGVYSFTLDTSEPLTPSVTVHFEYEVEDVCTADISKAKARWLTAGTLAWKTPGAAEYFLYVAPNGGIRLQDGQLSGGSALSISLEGTIDEGDPLLETYPYVKGQAKFDMSGLGDLLPELITGQVIAASRNEDGVVCDATGVQLYGLLDDAFPYDGSDLGLTWNGDEPTFTLWAPTAQSVSLLLFDDSSTTTATETVSMTTPNVPGTWTVTGDTSWKGRYYLYEVQVFVPSTGQVETNRVTDPYSVALSMNSGKSLVADLDDPALKPDGWDTLSKPPLEAFEDIVLYELHVRDFSASDATCPESSRGRFAAFTEDGSDGMAHLKALAEAGLTHVHLLPPFDIATIDEDVSQQVTPDVPEDAAPDSEEQQAAVAAVKDTDAYNWGYDPYHYMVPEGSYATDPQGTARILEFRRMVQALNEAGLRVVIDQVYNHTHAAGQDDQSVLDKIVPGYYYRLDNDGYIQSSSCCPDTATEHAMMEKLMIDSVVHWATAYKVDGFRFDLMGHHTRQNMENVRAALDALTLEEDGVDGPRIYLYGEAWKFGSLDAIMPDEAFSQPNTFGAGIGSFNDRIRDSVRGGNPFASLWEQGFVTGLYYDDNLMDLDEELVPLDRRADSTPTAPPASDTTPALDSATPTPVEPTPSAYDTYLDAHRKQLLELMDDIRIGLAGNLRDYTFTSASGEVVSGAQVTYRGSSGAGYTADPEEIINYVSVHDNQTLWDNIQAKAPFQVPARDPETATVTERVRMQQMGLAIIALGQGVPFFHAGSDMLRSKSGDGDSYDSGDWFNRIDFSYATNNWGVGLPIADKNQYAWDIWQPRLADPALIPSESDIRATTAYFQDLLRIRFGSPLFRLRTAEDIMARVRFLNAEGGPNQVPGLIVMALLDQGEGLDDLDPNATMIAVVFNATRDPVTFRHETLAVPMVLHEVLEASGDPVLSGADCGSGDGTVTAPPRTTLVCVADQ